MPQPLTRSEQHALRAFAEHPYVGSSMSHRSKGVRLPAIRSLADKGLVEMLRDKEETHIGGGWGAASYGNPTRTERVWLARLTDDGKQALAALDNPAAGRLPLDDTLVGRTVRLPVGASRRLQRVRVARIERIDESTVLVLGDLLYRADNNTYAGSSRGQVSAMLPASATVEGCA